MAASHRSARPRAHSCAAWTAALLLGLVALPTPAAASSPNPNQTTISALNGVIRQLFNRGHEEASAIHDLGTRLYGPATGGDLYGIAFSGEHGDGAWKIDRRMDWIKGLRPSRRWNHWWQSTRNEIAAEEAELHRRLRWLRDLWTAYDALILLRNQLEGPPPESDPGSKSAGQAKGRPPGKPPVHLPSPPGVRPPRVDIKSPHPRPRGKY